MLDRVLNTPLGYKLFLFHIFPNLPNLNTRFTGFEIRMKRERLPVGTECGNLYDISFSKKLYRDDFIILGISQHSRFLP